MNSGVASSQTTAAFQKRGITPKSQDISAWYTDVVVQSGMADYSPVRGCIVYRPLSYAIWERVQHSMDAKFAPMGIENSYFPLFIPESFLKKEAQHVEGFAPELAVVTIGGGEELAEKLVVRPTSETIMYAMYAKWIHSHRDLPLKLNQWNNVVRWEKRTFPFLRGMEYLWQEAHTAHATHEDAWLQVLDALDAYAEVYEDLLAVPVIKGIKSEKEKFAGATKTTTLEVMMPDGKALQAATSHDLGQNFSKAFEIQFQNEQGKSEFVWQTSFGYSTRSLGALIMVHGDDAGLSLPPNAAPTQVLFAIVGESEELNETAARKKAALAAVGVRVGIDARTHVSLGYKRNDSELKGIPLRLELGRKELEKGSVIAVIRHSGEKRELDLSTLETTVPALLEDIQKKMFEKAVVQRDAQISTAHSYSEFQEIMATKRGFIRAFWNEDPAVEAKVKEETKASTRCLPLDAKEEQGTCIFTGKPAKHQWLFAQAY